jgi:hypothetical protein
VKYCIDTSSILHAWIEAYPPDNFPPVWDKINDFIAKGKLISSEEVLRELKKKHDSAYQWAKGHTNVFLPLDEATQVLVAEIMSNHKRLVDTRKGRIGADPFVIAVAKLKHCTLVTNEAITNNLKRPNIPDVCAVMGVECINILQLFQTEGWVF